jgi:hypothetical protein
MVLDQIQKTDTHRGAHLELVGADSAKMQDWYLRKRHVSGDDRSKFRGIERVNQI